MHTFSYFSNGSIEYVRKTRNLMQYKNVGTLSEGAVSNENVNVNVILGILLF